METVIASGNRLSGVRHLIAETKRERKWLQRVTHAEKWQWQGDSLAVEARYAEPIIEGAQKAGFEVTS